MADYEKIARAMAAENQLLKDRIKELKTDFSEQHKDLVDQKLKAAALVRKKKYREALKILENT